MMWWVVAAGAGVLVLGVVLVFGLLGIRSEYKVHPGGEVERGGRTAPPRLRE